MIDESCVINIELQSAFFELRHSDWQPMCHCKAALTGVL
ncbi:hypothetical protein PSAB6_30367 [Paraburkholderia sabiae]|nr:hypothetical protein PSAB6_30367 [Paraburkholderia sabiae]